MARRGKRGRIHERRSGRALGKRALKAFEIFLCVGVMSVIGYKFLEYAEGSSDFFVRKVEVRGVRYLSGEAVLVQSGIASDMNILLLDEEAVGRKVEELPYVRTCRVIVRFPDTVVLDVTERVPEATVMVNARSLAIDREGVVLREYGPGEVPKAPFITMLPGSDFAAPGERLSSAPLFFALDVWESFRSSAAGEALTVSELAAYRVDDVRMYCDEVPYEIRWGRGSAAQEVQRFNVLWNEMDGSLICEDYVDLRFGTDLVCK